MQNLPHDPSCLSSSCNLIGYFKQVLKSDCLFLVLPVLQLEKRCDLKQKLVQFVNKSHQLEPIRLQGPPVISGCNKSLKSNCKIISHERNDTYDQKLRKSKTSTTVKAMYM